MKRALASLVLLVVSVPFISGCPTTEPHFPPAPSAECVDVCNHLREMDCDQDGEKTAKGQPCEEWLCRAHGAKLSCLAKATTCPQVERFQIKGCP